MRAPAHLTIVALLAAGAPAQQLDRAQAALLESARDVALHYSDSLPDFICTELVRRSLDPQGNGRSRHLDTLTVKLSYFEHKEDYKLMLINGNPTTLDYLSAGGALSTGEFGSRLSSIFDERSLAEFGWKGWSTLRKRSVARFSFRVAHEHSNFLLQYGTDPAGPNSILVAYHGEVYIDEQTHQVLRFTQEAEIPLGFPVTACESLVDYEFATVGGKPYLLPAHAHVKTCKGKYEANNDVDFRDYRKFQTETNITFDPPPSKKQ